MGCEGAEAAVQTLPCAPYGECKNVYQRCSAGCQSSCQNRGRSPGFCSSSFVSSFSTIALALPSLAPLLYPGTSQSQIGLMTILFVRTKDRVKVLSLESMLGFAVVKQQSNSLAQRLTFLLKILLWKHKPNNFLLCYITKCATSLIAFRDGSSNQPFVTWFMEIGGVYEITWNYGKTQVANILEDGLQTWK